MNDLLEETCRSEKSDGCQFASNICGRGVVTMHMLAGRHVARSILLFVCLFVVTWSMYVLKHRAKCTYVIVQELVTKIK